MMAVSPEQVCNSGLVYCLPRPVRLKLNFAPATDYAATVRSAKPKATTTACKGQLWAIDVSAASGFALPIARCTVGEYVFLYRNSLA
jgi:hypothetical protein